MDKLNRCQFCRSKPTVEHSGLSRSGPHKITIKCPHCQVKTTVYSTEYDYTDLEQRAADRWNDNN